MNMLGSRPGNSAGLLFLYTSAHLSLIQLVQAQGGVAHPREVGAHFYADAASRRPNNIVDNARASRPETRPSSQCDETSC